MRPGDLVRAGSWIKATWYLYGGEEVPWDGDLKLIPTDIPFGPGEVGLAIAMVQDPVYSNRNMFVKVVTPHGIGWMREMNLEEVG